MASALGRHRLRHRLRVPQCGGVSLGASPYPAPSTLFAACKRFPLHKNRLGVLTAPFAAVYGGRGER